MLQDTVAVVATAVDTIQVAADSLAAAVGSQIGNQVTTLVTLALSVVTKFAVDLAKKTSTQISSLPDPLKALVAVAFAQAATWVSVKTGLVVNPDISSLETTVAGLTVALSAMGVHAVGKVVTKK